MSLKNETTIAAKIYDQEGNLHPFVMRKSNRQFAEWLARHDRYTQGTQ